LVSTTPPTSTACTWVPKFRKTRVPKVLGPHGLVIGRSIRVQLDVTSAVCIAATVNGSAAICSPSCTWAVPGVALALRSQTVSSRWWPTRTPPVVLTRACTSDGLGGTALTVTRRAWVNGSGSPGRLTVTLVTVATPPVANVAVVSQSAGLAGVVGP
jgi:hypothetical protein